MATKRIGVLLSGCGVNDGAEIHESVLTLLAIDRAGARAVCMAPDKAQLDVVDHAAGKPAGETRNCMVEAARIARGEIQDVARVSAADLDALIMPGGFGAAKNLCTFATQGEECAIDPQVDRLLGELHAAGKPIGAICIAPAVVARHFQGKDTAVTLTIGTDAATAAKLETMGARHEAHPVDEIAVDLANKVVTTPAYMLAGSIKEAAAGIDKLVAKVVELA